VPVFKYKARSTHGEAITGTLEAVSSDAAAARLVEGGLTPVDIHALIERHAFAGRLQKLFEPNIESVDLIQFSRQMHSLLRAGVPILTAISGMAANCSNRTLAAVLSRVMQSLESGRPLSDALGVHPEVFSVFYVSLVRVGETSGQLVEIFRHLAFYLEREKKTRDQIKAAIRYPSFVIMAILAAIAIISIWVIPAFSGIFGRFDAELPLPTRMIIGFSGFVNEQWPWLLAAGAVLFAGARMYTNSEAGSYRWHKLKLRLPLAGIVIYQAALARFGSLFALAFQAGIPLITALTVVARALDNRYMEDRILGMREGIQQGKSLSLTAANSGIFDPLVLQMIAVGEESGTISELLQEVAVYYDQEVDYAIAKLGSAIEPVLSAVIGVLVLILAMGVFLPMWDLASAVLHGK
jgi:MSHA biogenesis protein MshG